jgi:hypothetical protein
MDENVIENSDINTVATFTHNSSGAPTAGFGVGIEQPFAWLFQADSSVMPNQTIGRISFEWEDATHAARQAVAVIEVWGTKEHRLVEVCRVYADGRIVKDEDGRNLRR